MATFSTKLFFLLAFLLLGSITSFLHATSVRNCCNYNIIVFTINGCKIESPERCSKRSRNSYCHSFDLLESHRDNINHTLPYPEKEEEHYRHEATAALLPVFFPKNAHDSSSPKPVTAEMALKKLLREKYRGSNRNAKLNHESFSNQYPGTCANNSTNLISNDGNKNAANRRLKSLILGTSIMGLRHWYIVWSQQINENHSLSFQRFAGNDMPPIPFPLRESITSIFVNHLNISSSFMSHDENENNAIQSSDFSPAEKLLVRKMVDEQAKYLSEVGDGNDVGNLSSVLPPTFQDDSIPPRSNASSTIEWHSPSSDDFLFNSSIEYSLQYSLPFFLTTSLLASYGADQTQQICSLMNHPGPITLRKNSIKFNGTDEDLCRLLWEEDGVQAIPLSKLLEENGPWNLNIQHSRQGRSNNKLVMTSPIAPESNTYVVESKAESNSNLGKVVPPDGCIRILPTGSLGLSTSKSQSLAAASADLPQPLASLNTTNPEANKSNNQNIPSIIPLPGRSKSIWSMKGWQKGYFEVQDAGSQIIVQSLEISPGDSVLDYCAGNGGKTFGLASTLSRGNHSGRNPQTEEHYGHSLVVAHDIVDERLRQIKGSLSRVGLVPLNDKNGNIKRTQESVSPMTFTTKRNSDDIMSTECRIQIANSSCLQSMLESCEYFDAVLVDAPCSSSGVLRRRPSQRWEITEEYAFQKLPRLQLEILERAAKFVKHDGGKLVYSTCSLLKEENEMVIQLFEQSNVFLKGGFERWRFADGVHGQIAQEKPHTLTLLPSAGSDGFFIARWRA